MLSPAVAVMAKVPGAIPVKSRLHHALTPDLATELYRCFLLDRLDAVAALPGIVPLVAFTPPEARQTMARLVPLAFGLVEQQGEGLGDRLTTLFDSLLTAGHAGAMAIDSDSPTLPMAFVAQAARALETGAADLVLGPCVDGGYYLVGLRVAAPGLFVDVPWSTAEVLGVTCARARALGLRLQLLPEWFDVDTEADLERLRGSLLAGEGGPARTRAFLQRLGVR